MVQVPTFKLSQRTKLAQFRIDEVLGEDIRTTLKQGKDLAKGSVANLFRGARGSSGHDRHHEEEHDEESLPARPVAARPITRAKTAPIKASVPFDISDDVLDRMFNDPDDRPRRPTSKFLAKQRQKAHLPEPSPRSTPVKSQAEQNRRPLDAEDVIYMFAGAPYFDVEHNDGRDRPRVVFGWGPTDGAEQTSTDFKRFEHKSYEAASLAGEPKRYQNAAEIPDMLSANGRDPGTIGFSHFLQLPIAQKEPDVIADDNRLARQLSLLSEPETLGLREFDIENVLDRIAELSKVYEMLQEGKGEAAEWNEQMIEEIGEDLFSTLLSDELGTTPAGTGSVTLRTQIEALQKVLKQDNLWFDFSSSIWRNEIGRILWDSQDFDLSEQERLNERDILMLQAALSAELAVRLEIACRLALTNFRHVDLFDPADLTTILRQQNIKLEWDLVLFQRFAKAFQATAKPLEKISHRRLSFVSSIHSESSELRDEMSDLTFQPRNEKLQYEGLEAFAAGLGWQHLSSRQHVAKSDSFLTPPVAHGRPSSYVSEYDTPLSSPVESAGVDSTHSLILLRESKTLIVSTQGAQQGETINDAFGRSWLSGFIMPGLSIQQCLMQTLLERSAAYELLQSNPAFDGGFVYDRQMYWSKESVVARVLASAEDAKDCMGWVSLPFVPQGRENGWISVAAKETQYVLAESRIAVADLVARTSDPLHQNDAAGLQAGDFVTPVDGLMVMGNEAQFFGVSLTPSKTSADIVNLTFRSPRNSRLPALTLPLTYAVHFVSSYPCYPYTRRRQGVARSPAFDSCTASDSGHSTPVPSPMDKDLPMPPAHPLHVDFTYTIIPAAALLSSALPEVKDSDSLLLMDKPDDPPSVYQIEDEEVVILDCRGSPDLEVLGRAWCAKVGENALIGSKGRTCLACCVREAMALGIGVVLRI